jgi:hypothetical protein
MLDFSEFKDLLHSYSLLKLERFQEDYAVKHSMLGKLPSSGLLNKRRQISNFPKNPRNSSAAPPSHNP